MNATMAADGRGAGGDTPGLLDRERIIAKPGFNRWLVPPAALAIHLCIGMAYGFSVFWLPLAQSLGITKPIACPAAEQTFLGTLVDLGQALFRTSCDWKVADLGWMYTLFFVFLGTSAAIWGGWLERAGPRKAGVVAAFCWGGGLLISALGVYTHQLWLMWLGSGIIGGIGLGLGYISPVSTLIKWFPDRRGMATGMAIMGFGGGAMIGTPLAATLMNGGDLLKGLGAAIGFPNLKLMLPGFKSATDVGVWQTFIVLGLLYFLSMMIGAFGYRVPPTGWKPEGWTPPDAAHNAMNTSGNVHLRDAHKTPQFWLIWFVLMLNVAAGIGVIGMAVPMLQEIFGGNLIGKPELGFASLDADQKKAIAEIAAGFAGLLSLFNIFGRFFWASLSDALGRKVTYAIFFLLGLALYASAPTFAHMGSKVLFVSAFCIILSMYGGAFATVPAYLADMFGTQYVGAIHGRLLTAWATAGIVGPVVVNYIREFNKQAGVPADKLYDFTMYVLASFLVLGFLCNLMIRPVAQKWMMTDEEMHQAHAEMHEADRVETGSFGIGKGGLTLGSFLAWLLIGIPIAWGVWITSQSAIKLFI